MDLGQDVGEGAGLPEDVDAVQPQCGVDYVEKMAKTEPGLKRGTEKETHAAGGDNGATLAIGRDTEQHQTQIHAPVVVQLFDEVQTLVEVQPHGTVEFELIA